jgi:uncharacterized membrane protein YcaP (DUF421 family)
VRGSQITTYDLPEKSISLKKRCLTIVGGGIEYDNELLAGRVSRVDRGTDTSCTVIIQTGEFQCQNLQRLNVVAWQLRQ